MHIDMKRMKNTILILVFSLWAGIAFSQDRTQPYNNNQNLRADLEKAIAQAQKENKNIMIQFGGNWCPWCIRFHALVNGTPKIDSLMKENYIYLLLNVPKEKEKRDNELFRRFEYPNRFGFPVFVILDKSGKRLNTQDSDAFEHPNPKVKGYDTTKVIRFLNMWTVNAISSATYQKK
jgi:thioredoxin-related protein